MQRNRGDIATGAVMRGIMNDKFDLQADQLSDILHKYDLGDVSGFEVGLGNFHNSVFGVSVADGRDVFLKVQHRPCTTQSLKADFWFVDFLRAQTDLPVMDLHILDEDQDVIPHPYILTGKMDGVNGLTFFEQANSKPYRANLANQFGRILGMVHALVGDVPDELHLLSLNDWRDMVDALVEGEFKVELEAFSQDRVAQLLHVMDGLAEVKIAETHHFLWGDPGFHNLLVDEQDGRVLCVMDFESGGYGHGIFDLHRARSNVKRRNPPEVYDDPRLIPAFEAGYASVGMIHEQSELETVLWEIVFCARGLRWTWDHFSILPRQTPELFDRLLVALSKLRDVTFE